MKSSQEFYDAAIPEPYTILGLRLRPLSLGHMILLHRIDSPLVKGGNIIIGDMAVAALICSRTYEDGIAALDDPSLPSKLIKWGYKLTHPHRIAFWKYEPIDLKAISTLFTDYIEYHTKVPCYLTKNDDATSIGAPQEQLVKINLLMKLHLTESEIMNRSWRLCLWDLLTLKAIEGQLEFMDEDEIEQAQRLANEYAQRLTSTRGN